MVVMFHLHMTEDPAKKITFFNYLLLDIFIY